MNDAKPTCGWNEASPYRSPESEPPVRSTDLVDAAVKYTSRIVWDKCTCCLGVGKLGIANTRRFMKCPLCNGKGETYKITSNAEITRGDSR